jgi:hypothetical protein
MQIRYVLRAGNRYGKVYAKLNADGSRLNAFGTDDIRDAHMFDNLDQVADVTAESKVAWEVCEIGVTRVVALAGKVS